MLMYECPLWVESGHLFQAVFELEMKYIMSLLYPRMLVEQVLG